MVERSINRRSQAAALRTEHHHAIALAPDRSGRAKTSRDAAGSAPNIPKTPISFNSLSARTRFVTRAAGSHSTAPALARATTGLSGGARRRVSNRPPDAGCLSHSNDCPQVLGVFHPIQRNQRSRRGDACSSRAAPAGPPAAERSRARRPGGSPRAPDPGPAHRASTPRPEFPRPRRRDDLGHLGPPAARANPQAASGRRPARAEPPGLDGSRRAAPAPSARRALAIATARTLYVLTLAPYLRAPEGSGPPAGLHRRSGRGGRSEAGAHLLHSFEEILGSVILGWFSSSNSR